MQLNGEVAAALLICFTRQHLPSAELVDLGLFGGGGLGRTQGDLVAFIVCPLSQAIHSLPG